MKATIIFISLLLFVFIENEILAYIHKCMRMYKLELANYVTIGNFFFILSLMILVFLFCHKSKI